MWTRTALLAALATIGCSSVLSSFSFRAAKSLQGRGSSVDVPQDGNNGLFNRQEDDSYWLPKFAVDGKQPLMPGDYQYFRNVRDFGAKGDGETDDSDAINKAVAEGNRCDADCGSTFASGAMVYFPPGTYKICKPIVQLYLTQFVGNPDNRPVIKGCSDFKGIALIDTDPYGPGGVNWYVNQNQFFRQIRNFVFDMTEMPKDTRVQDDLPIAPTGIHWQVAQATSLQNLLFKMPPKSKDTTHVGIITENGSGGFVADLVFEGGNIGWRAGSQQFTARGLAFKGCNVAVEMIWDWGFNWHGIEVENTDIAFNLSTLAGDSGQGVGSVSFVDCVLRHVGIGFLTPVEEKSPNVVIDGLKTESVDTIIQAADKRVFYGQDQDLGAYTIGKRYNGTKASTEPVFLVGLPNKPNGLLKDGKLFVKSKPQYGQLDVTKILDAHAYGIANDGSGDQTEKINAFLKDAVSTDKLAYFPAGIYQVEGTVTIPKDSKVLGSGWSQIMGTGKYFEDINNPKVMVQVGEEDEAGSVEIVDMLFTVKGPTAGAILMEWNIHEVTQGSVGMWDSHFRVGGAKGSDLDFANCPKGSYNEKCIAASLLFHLKPKASGYFENVWFWTGDHDNDMNVAHQADSSASMISVYAGRGALIESQGPSWFYGGGSEHNTLYQYQLYKASDLYIAHLQTETPYFQPDPIAIKPYAPGKFPGDPTFDNCEENDGYCKSAWGMRITDSEDIWINTAGFYSFFSNYVKDCIPTKTCQKQIFEVKGSKDVVVYNLFTIGATEMATGNGNSSILAKGNEKGYTTEVSVWLPENGEDKPEVVYVDPKVYSTGVNTALCTAPCIFVLPPSALPSTTTIDVPDYTTSLEVGTGTEVITTTITLTISAITTDSMQFSNVNITSGQTPASFQPLPSLSLPPQNVTVTEPNGTVVTRTVILPPWPAVTQGPPLSWTTSVPGSWNVTEITGDTDVLTTKIITSVSATTPTTTTLTFPPQISNFECPTTKVVTLTADETGTFSIDCTSAFVTTEDPLPTWTQWYGGIAPVATPTDPEDPDPEPTGGGKKKKTSCKKLWFFKLCDIKFDDWNLDELDIDLPSGKYGPGPPPPGILRPPPNVEINIKPSPFPWPQFEIGPEGDPTFPPEPAEGECETTSASICPTTYSYGYTVTGGETSTTTTKTITPASCPTIYGCKVKDYEPTTKVSACGIRNAPRTAAASLPIETAAAAAIQKRAPEPDWQESCEDREDIIIYPKRRDWRYSAGLRAILEKRKANGEANPPADSWPRGFAEISSKNRLIPKDKSYFDDDGNVRPNDDNKPKFYRGGFVAFYYVESVSDEEMDWFSGHNEVGFLYKFQDYNRKAVTDGKNLDVGDPEDPGASQRRDRVPDVSYELRDTNGTVDGIDPDIIGRGLESPDTIDWGLSQISTPEKWFDDSDSQVKDVNWWDNKNTRADNVQALDGSTRKGYKYWNQPDGTEEHTIYVVEIAFENHEELRASGSSDTRVRTIKKDSYGGSIVNPSDLTHGTKVLDKVGGQRFGVVNKANLVFVEIQNGDNEFVALETLFEGLLKVVDDVLDKGIVGKAVVNLSIGYRRKPHDAWKALAQELFSILDRLGVVTVVATGNNGKKRARISDFPARLGDSRQGNFQYENLVVVGAAQLNGMRAIFSQESRYITTHAPGSRVPAAGHPDEMNYVSGTSFAAPYVAGVITYYRAQQSKWQKQLVHPKNVKTLISLFNRPLAVDGNLDDPSITRSGGSIDESLGRRPMIWNGEAFGFSCLRDYDNDNFKGRERICPEIEDRLDKTDTDDVCYPAGRAKRSLGKRDCTHGEPADLGPLPSPITFSSGVPGPTCTGTATCGQLCTGYYCQPTPTGTPPDYTETKPTDPPDLPNGPTGPLPTLGPATGCLIDYTCHTSKTWPATCSSSSSCWGGNIPQPSSGCSYSSTCGPAPGGTAECSTSTSCWGGAAPTPIPAPPAKQVKYSCDGSGICGTPTFYTRRCDHAAKYLTDSGIYWGNGTAPSQTGNCQGDYAGYGCGVFLKGDGCSMRGKDMKAAYQMIRDEGHCGKCGRMDYSDGCSLTVDYVTGCNNRDDP
ncbi:pectate lyase superfamily protein-domain-containing protein [Hypoxylon sp. NC1633]|nr:pectate lyase superfamily protein-domain-containing protein [Hypoxylon sp. NC1633]